MKKLLIPAVILLAILMNAPLIFAESACTTLKDGVLTYSAGHYLGSQPIEPGYDIYGYNYQAHLFNGSYANVYLGRDGFPPYEGDTDTYLQENPGAATKWYWPYRDVQLVMKWNDAWLSNQDCDNDGLLDRHYGYPTYIGSGAWETNHQSGTYEIEVNGEMKTAHWMYFVKIVAAPADATKVDGVWYNANSVEIGLAIWGDFAIIQQVENDPFADIHGKQYGSPAGPGFGQYVAQ